MNRTELTLGYTLQGILDNSYGVAAHDGLNSFVFDCPQNTVKVTRRLDGWHPEISVEVDGIAIWATVVCKEDLDDPRINLFFRAAYEKMKEYERADKEMALSKFYRIFQ